MNTSHALRLFSLPIENMRPKRTLLASFLVLIGTLLTVFLALGPRGAYASENASSNLLIQDNPSVFSRLLQSGSDDVSPEFDNTVTELYRFVAPSSEINNFGVRTAVSGDTVVIGASDATVGGVRKGAVYVFRRVLNSWVLEATLSASNGSLSDGFGDALGIDGNTIVVGASGVDVNGQENQGSAYVFTRSGTSWSEQAILVPPADSTAYAEFGGSVAIDNGTIVVGAPVNVGPLNHGAVFVYTNPAGTWTLQQRLTAHDPGNGDRFAATVDIDNDTVAAAAMFADIDGRDNQGAAYVFTRNNGTWSFQAKLTSSDGMAADFFANSLSLSNYGLVVAAHRHNAPTRDEGAAYVFVRSGSVWTQEAKLLASVRRDGENLGGTGVAINGEGTAVVAGVPNRLASGGFAQGAAILFKRSETGWSERSVFRAVAQSSNSYFDGRVAAEGDQYFVGGRITSTGSVHLFSSALTSFDLTSSSDTGISDTDNITNAGSLVFDITGCTPGTTVELLRNGTIISSVIATSGSIAMTDPLAPPNQSHLYQVRQVINGEPSSPIGMTVTTDNIGPHLAIVAGFSNPTNVQPVRFTMSVFETVYGFDNSDITFAGSTAGLAQANIVLSGQTFPIGVEISNILSDGDIILNLKPNSITDVAGNGQYISGSSYNSVRFDTTRPAVTVNQAPGQLDPTRTLPVNFSVKFSEPVSDLDLVDISLEGSTVTGGLNRTITGSGDTYNVSISGLGPEGGILKVSVVDTAPRDQAGNRSLPSTSTDNTVVIFVPIVDGAFEYTDSQGLNRFWTSTSTRFGTSLCRTDSCGNGNGTAGPRNGSAWVWFDGSDNTNAETGTVSQAISFPAYGPVTLSYYLRVGAVNPPSASTLSVKIDGATVQTISEPSAPEPYTQQTIDVSNFANGGSHILSFEYHRPAGGALDNFSIDDVSLIFADPVPTPTPTPTATPTPTPTPTATPTPTPAPVDSTPYDFDGDGKADQVVFRPAEGVWYLLQSRDSALGYGFGLAGDQLTAADYDGDGRTDPGIYREGVWWVLNSNGTGHNAIHWGIASDIPVAADYDGDGKADRSVYRDGTWWVLFSSGAGYTTINWGIAGDKPVPADYDGDGKADFAVYRNGEWWILFANGSGYNMVQSGSAGDIPVPADYDGDGKADIAFYREGEWSILNTMGQTSVTRWGEPGDIPVPADYDGDGKTDISIYRNGEWWTLLPNGYTNNNWGIANDIPVSGR